MDLNELDYTYPEELIAKEPQSPFRTLVSLPEAAPKEIRPDQIAGLFSLGDLLVINDTQVLPRRIFTPEGFEVLFLAGDGSSWSVLFPASRLKGESLSLPGGLSAKMIERALPQKIETSEALSQEYFEEFGQMALPPYIQKARGERENRREEKDWYQTAWAKVPGSVAAPTASLHFQEADLDRIRDRGVEVESLTLHVGAGTFLPVRTKRLEDHQMHAESIFIPKKLWAKVQVALEQKRRVWALGTTVTRSLESAALGLLSEDSEGNLVGESDLFIRPGYEFQVVSGLMTNFHQPKSTLLALVMAFAQKEKVNSFYQHAIRERFRLFSYGDLSIWIR